MQDDFDDFDFSAQDYSEDDFFTEYIDRRKMKKVHEKFKSFPTKRGNDSKGSVGNVGSTSASGVKGLKGK